MSEELQPNDVVSHFLFYEGQINYTARTIKTSLITKAYPNGFSVFKTTNDDHPTIWQVAKDHVCPSFAKHEPPRSMKGRFDIEISHFWDAGLTSELQEPPPKHYNIHGMPVPSTEEGRQLSHRQRIVGSARLHLINDADEWAQYAEI